MRRLSQMRGPGLSDDRGAVAIMMALTLVILFGIAALVIDGSALYQERRELQNGADAAALAIARDCALGDCGAYNLTADTYVDFNANDGDSEVPLGGVTFPDDHTVRVEVITADAGANIDGDTGTVDYQFAPVLGLSGKQVFAAAEAQWGHIGQGSTLPIIISLCELNLAREGGLAVFPFENDEPVTFFFHTGSGKGGGAGGVPEDCAAPIAGQDCIGCTDTDGDLRLPGGFGWLDQDECAVVISTGEWVGAKPGTASPRECDPADLLDPDNQPLLIPVFVDLSEPGGAGFDNQCTAGPGGKCYLIGGFAALWVTGFRFPGGQSWVQGDPPPCNPPNSCLSGYFMEFTFEGTGTGPNDFGATAIWLSG